MFRSISDHAVLLNLGRAESQSNQAACLRGGGNNQPWIDAADGTHESPTRYTRRGSRLPSFLSLFSLTY